MASAKRVLLIGSPEQNAIFITWCQQHSIPFKAINFGLPSGQYAVQGAVHTRPMQTAETWQAHQVTHTFTHDHLRSDSVIQWLSDESFHPTFVVNQSELKTYLDLECALNAWYQCDTGYCDTAYQFFLSKQAQADLYRELNIATPRSLGSLLCVKRDQKNYMFQDDIPKFRSEPQGYNSKPGEFTQEWIDKTQMIGCRILIDGAGKWRLITTSCIEYENHLPITQREPVTLPSHQQDQINDAMLKLSQRLSIRNKIVHWEWLVKQGELLAIDVNARLGGDQYTHHTDHRVFGFDYAGLLLSSTSLAPTQLIHRIRASQFAWNGRTSQFSEQKIIARAWREDFHYTGVTRSQMARFQDVDSFQYERGD